METWRDIKGYEGLYQVSDQGKVRSLDRYVSNNHLMKGQILKQHLSNRQYWKVYLVTHNKVRTFQVHRLVAEAFIPNPESKPCVDHINCDKNNNTVFNLRWCTHSENMMNDITYTQNLIAHEKAKKPVACYSLSGDLLKEYPSISSVKEDGYNAGMVSEVCSGKRNIYRNLCWRLL